MGAHGSVNGDASVNHDVELDKTNLHLYDMQVPDRILVAGSDRHIPSKSTPRELQLEHSVLPPTPEHVRVHTPPRSIKLGEVHFPASVEEGRTPQEKTEGGGPRGPVGPHKGG